MMTCRRLFAASLLLCAPLSASAAPASLTPEQTYDLYARMLLEDDATAARALNDALRPAFDGKDALTHEPGAFAKALAAPLQGLLTAAGGDAATREAMPAVVAANLAKTQCRAQRSALRDNDAVEGSTVATVEVTCQVTALDSLRPLFDTTMQENDAAAMKHFMDTYVTALRSGPRKTVQASVTLYSGKDNGYWYSGNLDSLVAPVVDALMPFDAWSQEAAAKNVPTITGVATCDLLMHEHRTCIAKVAPDQVLGVDLMGEELRMKAQEMTPVELANECKALRPIAEMMWTEACR